MKKLLVVLALLAGLATTSHADGTQGVYFSLGPLNLTLPWDNPQVTYLYDFEAKSSLVGGEAQLAQIWKFGVSAGAVTSLQGQGAPFVGVDLELPNPAPQFASLAAIHPGAFGGYNFTSGKAMFGLKASVAIF